MSLSREEYVEQAYFFRALRERLHDGLPIQELLTQIQQELLATTNLPMAIGFLCSELKHHGVMAEGMRRIKHYFSSWQAYLIEAAEDERGRFEFTTALQILEAESRYRSEQENRQGIFFFQFEALSRNRLNYDRGLKAMSEDSVYDANWSEWLLVVRRQLGLVDLGDLIYGRSQAFAEFRAKKMDEEEEPLDYPILFGEKEGRIAFANRHKDPLYLFAAMQRHLGYPTVPRPQKIDESSDTLRQTQRRVERLEARLQLMEEENRIGVDLTKFYKPPS
jgi:hypothetical protein